MNVDAGVVKLGNGACAIPDCINSMSTVGARGVEEIPHPLRDTCVPSKGTGYVRPLRADPTTTNGEGGLQSFIPETFTTMPLRALQALSQLSRLGDEKYGPHNWRKIPETDHIDHAFAHMLGHSLGDETEDHLVHAAWRLVAALEVRLTEKERDQ